MSEQMPSEHHSARQPALLEGRFHGPTEFAEVVRQAFATAALQNWRDIIISDATFKSWPLGERSVAQSLQQWAKTGRTLTVLARNYDEIVRRHGRFVTWRRTWAHLVVCRANSAVAEVDFPSAIWSAGWMCQRLDLVHSIGTSGSEPARQVVIKERLNECLRRSAPAFPATTLGL